MIIKVGPVCHKWNYRRRQCAEAVNVYRVSGTESFHFISKLAVDADGSPKAYHPRDRRPRDNFAKAYDWLANIHIRDLHGIQGKNGAHGPEPGYYISGTALFDRRYRENDARRFVDAASIPYIVAPLRQFPRHDGLKIKKGCVCFVADTRSGYSTGAIFADVGRAVGEGSVALGLRMGLKPFYKNSSPKVSGFEGKRFFYLLFPNVTIDAPWSLDEIQKKADYEFGIWGGEARLRAVFPDFPPLRRPIDDPEFDYEAHTLETLEGDEELEGLALDLGRKGLDVSKLELEFGEDI